jgi:hypothetical protein
MEKEGVKPRRHSRFVGYLGIYNLIFRQVPKPFDKRVEGVLCSLTSEKLPDLTMQPNVLFVSSYYYFTSHIETCRALRAGLGR